jgi:ABC-type sulfate transport system permease component
VPFVSGALLIGIIQSLVTPWGLFRHYWIIAKLVLTLFALSVLLLQLNGIDQLARAAADSSFTTDAFASLQASLIIHASGGLVVVLLALVLSIYKPRGMTRYGVRRMRSAR